MYICTPKHGNVAEWLGSALQKLLQRFESARYLKAPAKNCWGFLFSPANFSKHILVLRGFCSNSDFALKKSCKLNLLRGFAVIICTQNRLRHLHFYPTDYLKNLSIKYTALVQPKPERLTSVYEPARYLLTGHKLKMKR